MTVNMLTAAVLLVLAAGCRDEQPAASAGKSTDGSKGTARDERPVDQAREGTQDKPGAAGAGTDQDPITDPMAPLRVVYRPDGVTFQPNDEAWRQIRPREVQLLAQMVTVPRGGGATTRLSVQAMHDGQWLTVRLRWSDAGADRAVRVDRFRDSVAIGFPAKQAERLPSPFMGDADLPVNIWQWTADFDASARGAGAFDTDYPHTEGVWYFPQDDLVTSKVRAWRGFEPVIELEARGWGSLERKGTQNVFGTGTHDGSHWSVVFRRQLSTGSTGDTLFRPGDATHTIFAVWDGRSGEVNGKKSISMTWLETKFDDTRGGRK